MGKARFFLFVIKINRDIDVWDELFCETQGRWSKRVEMSESGRLRDLTDRQGEGQELGIREYDPARDSDP